MNNTPEIGHNRPPIREILAERTNDVGDYLAIEGKDLISRCEELIAEASELPAIIEDADEAAKTIDTIKRIAAAIKSGETRRVGDKEPVLQAGRVIDGFYGKIKDALDKTKRVIEKRLTVYQREMARLERQRREKEEHQRREEEERLKKDAEESAKAAQDQAGLDAAIDDETAAKEAAAARVKAEEEAKAKASALHKDRGDTGANASLRTEWKHENLDRPSLDLEALRSHIPLDALEKAVRSFIRAGGRELTGVRIFEDTHSVVR